MTSPLDTAKSAKQPTLAMLRKEVHRLYGTRGKKDEDESFEAGVCLLASAFLGPNIRKISDFTGISEDKIRPWAANLRQSGVWGGKKVYAGWFDEGGGVSFICDTMVMQGLLRRA